MVNLVILVGRLGRDPEVKYTNSGSTVANFSLATDERRKDQSGKSQTKTEWHNITAWGKLAEICEQYLKKGALVYIEGRLQTQEWNDKDGNKRRTTEVVAKVLQMLDGKQPAVDNAQGDPAGDNPDEDLKKAIWQKMTMAKMPQGDAVAMWNWAEDAGIKQKDLLKNFDNFRKGWENYKAAQTETFDDDIPF